AVSLADQLRRETQSKISVSSMQGIFPTITKFGMAALLPHKKLSVELKSGKTERLTVLADSQSTESGNRDRLLKNTNEKSVALKYKDIIGMKRADRQALVKGMDVVYIYHDTIDEAGHLDKSIFGACDEAIDELKNVVRIITNEFGGANILITSDHGFLYTYSPLNEDDKVDKTTESEQDIEIGRRYAIMQKGAQPQYLLPVKFLGGKTNHDAFAPRESIRIKTKGGGLNFVHGGISLQEMVVPVIDYHFLRNDSKEYRRNRSKYDTKPVIVNLLSANHKISNMIFSLSFYQKEAVAANREAATYQLYFTDSSGKTISDVSRIIADKTSDNAQERTFRCSFNLKSLKYSNTETYYLVIADEDGLQISREEFQIDIAFAVDEFDFFS
ncbi:PglZ domain-containing protein, partial [uncultured Bacteroides sp.]|uniref:PglZ domain-containing protein n=1 Tax=uncultured Bacteroides sp. TaxID=162156 RepID=UPI002595C52A